MFFRLSSTLFRNFGVDFSSVVNFNFASIIIFVPSSVLFNYWTYIMDIAERQVSMSIHFDTENQNESVVLDHEEELWKNQRSPEMES